MAVQYNTRKEIARGCVNTIINNLIPLGYDHSEVSFLEPAAGAGAFLRAIDNVYPWLAVDKNPQLENVKKADYLTTDMRHIFSLPKRETLIVFGAPPVGKNGKVAVNFLNRSFVIADTVGFILPKTFDEEDIQKRIVPEANFVSRRTLPSEVFEGHDNDEAVFQIWSLRDHKVMPNKRVQQWED